MRTISDTFLTVMQRKSVSTFLLVKIGPNKDGITYRYTTLPYDYTYEGELYLHDNGLMSLDPPRMSDILDREAYSIKIADPEFLLRPFLEGGTLTAQFTGANIKVMGGLINIYGVTEFGTAPNTPYPDVMVLYAGYLDEAAYSINYDEEIVLEIEGSSPMGALDLTRSLIVSKNALNEKYPTDTSYDQLYEGSSKIELLWGKKL